VPLDDGLMMMRHGLVLVAFLLANLAVTSWAQRVYIFNGVAYSFPTAQGDADTSLSAADDDGALEWAAVATASEWPSGLVVFSPTGTCPPGWSEYTDARGRYLVGLVSGGTNEATVGTALTNGENRSVGQHTHAITDPGHTHAQNAHTHSVSDSGHSHGGSLGTTTVSLTFGGDGMIVTSGSTATSSSTVDASVGNATPTNIASTTGIALANAGSVAGTNAPYIQLRACLTP
jgi:hypothetical protein